MANFINLLFNRLSNVERHITQMDNKLDNYYKKNNWRTIDGSSNNILHPDWGKSNIKLLRQSASRYEDNISSLAVRGINNPNPRIISNLLCKTNESIVNENNLSDMMWIWGQFLDHEIDLTPSQANNPETANIITPNNEEDPNEDFPDRTISFTRSSFVINNNPREQPNNISSYIDASNVYGHNTERAYYLRRLDGSGKLKTIKSNNGEDILPYNNDNFSNASPGGTNPENFFIAGDIRSNENIFLTSIHILFVREHNRLCDIFVQNNPKYTDFDEIIYQYARKIVIGIMQNITYNEFLPKLLGENAIDEYSGYKSNVNPGINNEFSTVGYRVGHSMLASVLHINNTDKITLRDAFFIPSHIQENGVDNLLLGGTKGLMQKIDTRIVEDVRSFLFGAPDEENLLDLASLNIQRGRDHGIPDYNTLRAAYGLEKVSSFTEITKDTVVSNGLAQLYNTVDDIDPWIGGLAEDHLNDANVGPLFYEIIRDQFIRLRDGDRYYYKNDDTLTDSEKMYIENTKLGDVIERNTGLENLGDVFIV